MNAAQLTVPVSQSIVIADLPGSCFALIQRRLLASKSVTWGKRDR